jgi:hypothetical protein
MKGIRHVALATMTLAFVAAAEAAATKINSCPKTITQPGLYEVQDNLDSVGTCIRVAADSVTIDLGGFRIRGNGTGSAVTSFGPVAVRDTTVRNGSVTQFENGIEVESGSVENVTSARNANVGILVITGAVRNSRAEGNSGNWGISTAGRSIVTGNISVGNRDGITATYASVIQGNVVADNTNSGIQAIGTGGSITQNSVFNNSGFGIYVSCPTLVLGNTVVLNGTNIRLNGPDCKVEQNATQ